MAPMQSPSLLLRQLQVATGPGGDYVAGTGPFTHLLNFFADPEHAPGAGAPRPRFHRFFEFVRVSPPFIDSELHLNPTFASTPGHLFHIPFQRIPWYREPGRINLNTIFSRDVFRGLLNLPDYSDGGGWNWFVDSRRGYGTAGSGQVVANSDYPTYFANPFRSFSGYELAPPTQNGAQTDTTRRNVLGCEINSTILRERGIGSGQPLFEFVSAGPTTDTNRNPFFRYSQLQRLSQLATTRSNVYAVWLTLGYFEVDAVLPPNPAVYPDGYRLGPELGIDTGDVQRHRAFYLIDPSIPVAFERGQDHNVRDTILLKRFIERRVGGTAIGLPF